MLLTISSLFIAQANEDCVLDSVRFADVSISQSTVLQKYGATCQDAENTDRQAQELYKKATEALAKGDIDLAKQYLSELEKDFDSTRVWRSASRLKKELDVIGISIPEYVGVEWIQGNDDISTGTVLLVFWEAWCPHCVREVPNLQKTYEKYQEKGLRVVGLTKMSRSSTPEKVSAFLQENNIQYPIGKENGEMTALLNVSGIPAAALIHNGKVIWRGHPARIEYETFAPYIAP